MIEMVKQHCPDDMMISFELRPFQEVSHIRAQSCRKKVVPFLTQIKLREIAQLVEPYRPENYSVSLFYKKIGTALERASQEKLAQMSNAQTSKKSDIAICCARKVK